MMPLLATMNLLEMKTFWHMIQNEANEQSVESQIIDDMVSNRAETFLAKLSEEANFEKKNYYRHNAQTLHWADKKRQPVSKSKVTEMLRHQDVIKTKVNKELNTYMNVFERDQF